MVHARGKTVKRDKQESDPARTWFQVMRAAREAGDRELEGLARQELDRLGFRVSIRRPGPQEAAP
jgi:hypothetical protein